MLNKIQREYCIPLTLYENIKKSMKYQQKNDMIDVMTFVKNLSGDLKIEASYYIFEPSVRQIKFFQNKSMTFIAWICPLLTPLLTTEKHYVFYEDDEVNCIYIFKQGKAGYVLPRHKNLMYLTISKGNILGVTCIIANFLEKDKLTFQLDKWMS